MDNKIDYKGYTINILPDDDPQSPREWDNLGKMACMHKKYTLGDITEKHESDNYTSWNDFKQHLITEHNAFVILPLFLYDHSGITMYTQETKPYLQHEAWDSGQVGFIYATRADIQKEYSVKRITKKTIERVKSLLTSEVKTYDQFLTGDVWGYTIEGLEDSCYGYYGQEYAIQEAKSAIDWQVEQDKKKKEQKTKQYIKHNVPLEYRIA